MEKLEVHASICDGIKDLYRRKLYDKFSRYMNLSLAGEDTAQVDESIDDTLMDMANYAIMELTERRLEREEKQ